MFAGMSGRGSRKSSKSAAEYDEHLPGAVEPQEVVALAGRHHPGPALEVLQLALGALREQVVGDARGELALPRQLLDDLVVVGVVLEAAAGVDHARHAEAVQLAHEAAGRVELILERELRALGERRVQDPRVRPGDQQPGGIAALVALDLAARRLGRVLGVADGAKRGAVEQRPVVEMQDEDRRVGRRRVDLLQRRQAALLELERRPAADDADPVRRRRPPRLLLQQRERVGERRHAVPAQLEVVVEAAADRMRVRVVQAGDHGAAPTSITRVAGPFSRITSATEPTLENLPPRIETASANGRVLAHRGEPAVA